MNDTSELGGLYCELHAPLEWEPRAASDSPADSDLVNQNRLKIILGLDEVIHEAADENLELSQELQRLDFKVNIILELVGQLFSHNLTLPPSATVKLGPNTVEWSTQAPPAQGQTLEIRLYLDPRFPFPLSLTGQIASLTQTPAGSQVQLALDPMAEQTQDLLEKYIFRCHRRHIARMKTRSVNN